MKVKAKASFKYTVERTSQAQGFVDTFYVHEGDVIDLEGAQLEYSLKTKRVTKDLDWTPEQRGGQ